MENLLNELKKYDIKKLLESDDEESGIVFIEFLKKMKEVEDAFAKEVDSPFILENMGKAFLIESVKKKFETVSEQLNFILNHCKKNGYTEEKPFSFNDLDNSIWSGKINNKEYICLTTYDIGYFVLNDNEDSFIIWEMFQDYHFIDEDKYYTIKKSLEDANSHRLYSDNVDGNTYVSRPNFAYFKEKLEKGEKIDRELLHITDFSFLSTEDASKFFKIDTFYDAVKLAYKKLQKQK